MSCCSWSCAEVRKKYSVFAASVAARITRTVIANLEPRLSRIDQALIDVETTCDLRLISLTNTGFPLSRPSETQAITGIGADALPWCAFAGKIRRMPDLVT